MDLSIVIPSYRRPDLLRTCLDSVLEELTRTALAVEVVVVEDGGHDESCAVVRSAYAGRVRLVVLPENRGYPGAVNAGIAVSTGCWVLTLNNDTTVCGGAFDEAVRIGDSAADVGSVALQQRFSSRPGVLYSAGLVLDRRGQNADRLMGRPLIEGEEHPVEVFGACGAAALYRRSALDGVGGFDERFRFGLEDADVSWRLQAAGFRCLYAPGAVVMHDLGATVPHGSDLRLHQAGRNRVLLLAKNLHGRQALRHAPSIVLFDVLYVAYGLVRLRSLEPVRGRWEGLRMAPRLRREQRGCRRRVPLQPATAWADVLRRRRSWALAGSA